jgi:hypothetical protein
LAKINPINRLWRDCRGLQAVELALLLPIFFALIFGVFEIGRYLLINQKVSRAAHTLASMIGQSGFPRPCDISNMLTVANAGLSPFDISVNQLQNNAVFAISGVNNDGSVQRVWACTLGNSSFVPNPGEGILSGSRLTLNDNEGAYSIDVVYDYQPVFFKNMFTKFLGTAPNGRLTIRRSIIVHPSRSRMVPLWSRILNQEPQCSLSAGVQCN